jgi:hypothetical protein
MAYCVSHFLLRNRCGAMGKKQGHWSAAQRADFSSSSCPARSTKIWARSYLIYCVLNNYISLTVAWKSSMLFPSVIKASLSLSENAVYNVPQMAIQ